MTKLSKSEESLAKKVARGGFWIFALRAGERSLGLIRIIIVARLLSPNDFGLLGIALLTISILEAFSDTGFQAALVQRNEKIASYLDTAWTISVIRGSILFVTIFLLAPYVGYFFDRPDASFIIKVMGVTILLRSFSNIGIVYFQKELQFNKLFIYKLSYNLVEFIVTVLAAFILKNVWALVLGSLAGGVGGLFASYLFHSYRPRFDLNFEKAKKLFGFGKWMFGSSILVFLITQGDDVFVGKVLGLTMLGLYQMAYRISNIPTTEISRLIHQLAFPAYSKMQDNLPRLREAYLEVLQITTFLCFPLAGLIFITAPDLTQILLGEKWMPMVPAMQVLSLWGLVRAIGVTSVSVIYAVGMPKLITKYQLYQLSLIIILIYPLTMGLGIVGTSLAILIASIVPNYFAAYSAAIKTIKCNKNNILKILCFPLLSSMTAMASVYFLHAYWFIPDSLLLLLIVSIVLYCFTYFLAACFCDRFTTYKIKPLIKHFVNSLT